jgi:ABC-type spermidine/putrescine transport system permease subunit II
VRAQLPVDRSPPAVGSRPRPPLAAVCCGSVAARPAAPACGSLAPGRGDRRRGGKSASPIRLLPEVSLALPLAVALLRWGLLDTRLGVILASLTMALPVAAWMLSTTFSTIRS